jgi:hypothetical protein
MDELSAKRALGEREGWIRFKGRDLRKRKTPVSNGLARRAREGLKIGTFAQKCDGFPSITPAFVAAKQIGGRSGVVIACGYEMPHEENDQGADHGPDQSRIFPFVVDVESLPDISRKEGSDDAQDTRQDEALWIIRRR